MLTNSKKMVRYSENKMESLLSYLATFFDSQSDVIEYLVSVADKIKKYNE